MTSEIPNTPPPAVPGFWKSLGSSWAWKMAWRDSRASRWKLLLFSSSIILGIAALVAIGSLGNNLREAVDEQAKTLLAADLVLSSRSSFSEEEEKFFESLGGQQAREIRFSSMAYFPKNAGTRLVQIRALKGNFPFYGSFEVEPSDSITDFKEGKGALLEETILLQLDASFGDEIRLGEWSTRIKGVLKKLPGESIVFSSIMVAPRVYIAYDDIEKTGLLKDKSLSYYRVYFKFPPGTDVPGMVRKIRPQLEKFHLQPTTAEERKESLGQSIANLNHFLNLVAFVSLILGAVGVASSIYIHVKQKLNTVAVIRCLGASAAQSFSVYLIQAMALGSIGAFAGAAIGICIQLILPTLLQELIPIQLNVSISWSAILGSMIIGWGITILFALLPLVRVRLVSPLLAIRSSYETGKKVPHDRLQWLLYLLVGLSVLLFAIFNTQKWYHGVAFAAALGIVFMVLGGVSFFIMFLAKKMGPLNRSYILRQGLANLYRPNNRTLLLMVSLGLGTFLLLTMVLTRELLLKELAWNYGSEHPNVMLFDIQPEQRSTVGRLLRSQYMPVLEEAAIVTMRLTEIQGKKVEEILEDPESTIPRWVLEREYRSSYRAQPSETERIIEGEWISKFDGSEAIIPISLEQQISRDLGVEIGDQLTFDVQGIPMMTRVASLRKVEWRRLSPNFFVVFPEGVLEEAPQFFAIATRVNSSRSSANLQREVVKRFPNVSAVDITLILQTIDAIINKVSHAVRFMASFTVITALLVLAGAILTGRYQRIRESILLRTLGATRIQILKILAVEYFLLGLFAAVAGLVLSIGATWGLAVFIFKMKFSFAAIQALKALVGVSVMTLLVGLASSRGISTHSPLEILRAET